MGPGPHCAMLFADLGAEILRIERDGGDGWPNPVVERGRARLTLDLRSPADRERAIEIVAAADILIEGNRPGVMERLGLGPDAMLDRNPRLIYGRMTGWGQTGPLAATAGHDINYIALSGVLGALGAAGEVPQPPLNLIGDFGGGSMFLAFGIMAALWERERSGKGQVVDAAIVDGVASMLSIFTGMRPGLLNMERGHNVMAGAAPHYRCYRCADDRFIAVGAMEAKFHAELLERIGAPSELTARRTDDAIWAETADLFAEIFARRTRDEWCTILEGADACFTPVLDIGEVPSHPHIAARETYMEADTCLQPAPAPRFSRTPGRIGSQTDPAEMLARWGLD